MTYTATEIAYRMRAADLALSEKDFTAMCRRLDDVLLQMLVDYVATGKAGATYCARHVCAKRARKLRRRGEHVFYSDRTATGKARYTWIRTIRIAL